MAPDDAVMILSRRRVAELKDAAIQRHLNGLQHSIWRQVHFVKEQPVALFERLRELALHKHELVT